MSEYWLIGARLFDGDGFQENSGLHIADGTIRAIARADDLPGDIETVDLKGGLLTPGFVDAQVNGGGGHMLNDGPTREVASAIAAAHRRYGTTALLPTLITDTPEVTEAAIEALSGGGDERDGIAGLHLEGPHLAPARKGAHPAELMRRMEERDVARLIAARESIGTLVVTLACEQVEPRQVARLSEAGVIVSLGHTDCRAEDAVTLFDAGARGATHLFNAMSRLSHRAPGLVGAALDRGDIWAGIIADGHHVDETVLRLALRCKRGPAKLFFVTDAMALVGGTQSRFTLHGRQVKREAGDPCSKLTLEDGTLAGSDLDMASAIRYGLDRLELSLEDALAMATSRPAHFLGIDGKHGTLQPGTRADLVHMSDGLDVLGVWMAGVKTG